MNQNSILTDRAINILTRLRREGPETCAEQDRANIEKGLELLAAQVANATPAPVVYETKAE